jgi:hypothetical protein
VVVGVAAAVALVLAGAGALALRGPRHSRVRTAAPTTTVAPATTTTVAETTTTYDLVPQTTTTVRVRAPSTTTSTAAPLPVVSAAGAVLKTPGTPTTRTLSATGCKSLGSGEGWAVECGTAHAKGGTTLIWLVEEKAGTPYGAPAGRRVYVFAPAPAGAPAYRSLLEARDEDASKWALVVAKVVDLSGDGAEDVAVGFRSAGSGALALDVVEGPGAVTAHRDLPRGAARVSTGQCNTWAESASAPGRFDNDVIRWQDGAWRVVLRSQVAEADVPPSQF